MNLTSPTAPYPFKNVFFEGRGGVRRAKKTFTTYMKRQILKAERRILKAERRVDVDGQRDVRPVKFDAFGRFRTFPDAFGRVLMFLDIFGRFRTLSFRSRCA